MANHGSCRIIFGFFFLRYCCYCLLFSLFYFISAVANLYTNPMCRHVIVFFFLLAFSPHKEKKIENIEMQCVSSSLKCNEKCNYIWCTFYSFHIFSVSILLSIPFLKNRTINSSVSFNAVEHNIAIECISLSPESNECDSWTFVLRPEISLELSFPFLFRALPRSHSLAIITKKMSIRLILIYIFYWHCSCSCRSDARWSK